MGLEKYLTERTMLLGRFNYWERSLSFTKDARVLQVHHSKRDGVNIVIIEDQRIDKNNKNRTDWYFGTFTGRHSGECENAEQLKQFYEELRKIATRKHRIAGKRIDEAVLKAVEQMREY